MKAEPTDVEKNAGGTAPMELSSVGSPDRSPPDSLANGAFGSAPITAATETRDVDAGPLRSEIRSLRLR